MATQQENPDKGLLMIGAVAGGILLLGASCRFLRSDLIPIPRRRTGSGPWCPNRRNSPARTTPERGDVAVRGRAGG